MQDRLAEGARVWAHMEEGKIKAPTPGSRPSRGSHDGDSPGGGSVGGF
eukprot:CAMPEP_0202848288 /NCGR_PEP_ID=MMETSP1389-20130828/77697_1 /ASSEMBLY_ACC=CAM_ASM_000865 /TAXON_ID=302021 /ORGANISM="Rhodomonas sp., Strain CCMP768" /LENGTH=47 /DNA_ID= /DNA_START= /DNA_END= /DNA_ORIENTATION=